MTSHRFSLAALAASSLWLAACGGGTSDDAPPPRGTIVLAQLATPTSPSVTAAQIDAGTTASGLLPLSGAAQCDVDVRYVVYLTRDPAGQPATASEGILVPTGSNPACSGNRPVVLYAHGTATEKSKNMADVVNDSEASLQMAMFAAQGFIVVAPNYLGYDVSSAGFHPYLNAEAQAIDMVDGLRAAKAHLAAQSSTKPSATLLITGYSQGGHVAMATHKIIERDYASEFTVTASGPMSGPYNLLPFTLYVSSPTGQVNAGATIFTPMLLTSYQKSYGGIYASPSDVYQAPYDASAENLFPTDTPVADLIAAGKLPNDGGTFTKLYGPGGLLKDSFVTDVLTNSANPFAVALGRNTLVGTTTGWTPQHPVALCGGAADPTVFFALNTTPAQADFAARGLPVPAFDLESRASLPAGASGDAIYGGFQGAKAAAGAQAQAQYHGSLVPPFCTALVRGFFETVLAAGQ